MSEAKYPQAAPTDQPIQGLTRARCGSLAPNVLLWLEWEGPVGAKRPAQGQVQVILSEEDAYRLGMELVRLSGRVTAAEPQGRA